MLSNRRIGRCRKEGSPIFFCIVVGIGMDMMSQDVVRCLVVAFWSAVFFLVFSLLICTKEIFSNDFSFFVVG